MFSLINNLVSLGLWLLIGIPILLFLGYFMALAGHVFLGGPLWLWIIIVSAIIIGGAVEQFNKQKLKESTE
ncbi:MAG TPA: hypothetical protein VN426_06120 [Syntrophomonadaceae bacterium]|nr:hypothetical protein [Syntrophomonadaceae bacterium]